MVPTHHHPTGSTRSKAAMSVGNHARHRLVSQYREMRVIRWRVKDGVVDYFYSTFSLIQRTSCEEAGNPFCQSELIFYIRHNGIGVFFAVNAATGIKRGKNTQRGCAFLPFCLVRDCFPRCRSPPPASEIWFPIFQKCRKRQNTVHPRSSFKH